MTCTVLPASPLPLPCLKTTALVLQGLVNSNGSRTISLIIFVTLLLRHLPRSLLRTLVAIAKHRLTGSLLKLPPKPTYSRPESQTLSKMRTRPTRTRPSSMSRIRPSSSADPQGTTPAHPVSRRHIPSLRVGPGSAITTTLWRRGE